MKNITNKTQDSAATEKVVPVHQKLAQEFLSKGDGLPPTDAVQPVSSVWCPDNGDGTYTNPILYADYSDPDVICLGRNYYMTASSFSCIPGLPILHSKDLVNWTLIGHALQRYPNKAFDRPQHGKGVWAPSIRFHNNRFYIYWGDPDAGIYMVRSGTPVGPWDEPILVLPGLGMIDPCPLWDEDGKAYLVHAWAASRAGIKSLLTVRPMNAEGTQADPDGKHVFDGHDSHPTIEGPKFYKHNGYYYILAPAGGVKNGWQTALRSRQVYGPYEAKIVLQQGSTAINGPHQGGWVQTPFGSSWFLHFQDAKAYGRIIHLQPVTWQDDWPMMGRRNGNGIWEPLDISPKPDSTAKTVPCTPQESDEFNDGRLGLQWQWQANPKQTWYTMLPNTTYLRLFPEKLPDPSATLWEAPNLLLQKFPAPDFTAITRIKFTPEGAGEQAGLVIMGEDYACLSITSSQSGLMLSQRVCENASTDGQETIIEEIKLSGDAIFLQVNVASPHAECRFRYSTDGDTYHVIGKPFRAKPGKWIGAKVGLFCISRSDVGAGGYADVDWFRVK